MRRTSQSWLQPATLLLGLLGSLGALPASASMLYDSGPLPYYYSGTSIAYKDSITNSFTLAVDSTVRWVEFPVLAFHGDTPMSVDYLITMDHFGGTVMASGTASLSSYFQFPWPFGNYGGPVLDVEVETFSVLPEIFLNAGTYWLQLQNAGTAQDENLYWIENNGLS